MSWGALKVAAGAARGRRGCWGQWRGPAAFRERARGPCLGCVCVQPCARGCGRPRLRTEALPAAPAGAEQLGTRAPGPRRTGERGAWDRSWDAPSSAFSRKRTGPAAHPGDNTRCPCASRSVTAWEATAESPLRGHGRCAQPLSGSGAGGLVASPPFPSSVWLDSWAPLEALSRCEPRFGLFTKRKGKAHGHGHTVLRSWAHRLKARKDMMVEECGGGKQLTDHQEAERSPLAKYKHVPQTHAPSDPPPPATTSYLSVNPIRGYFVEYLRLSHPHHFPCEPSCIGSHLSFLGTLHIQTVTAQMNFYTIFKLICAWNSISW
ncbi:uncharacterized protein LOC110598741 isoform X2 [Ictidomys tridecemlineatus]